MLDDETLRYWATPESEVGDGELGRIDLKDIIKLETTGIAPSKGEAELAFTVHGADRVFQLWCVRARACVSFVREGTEH